MIDVTKDIHSMTTFKRNSSDLMKRMRKSGSIEQHLVKQLLTA